MLKKLKMKKLQNYYRIITYVSLLVLIFFASPCLAQPKNYAELVKQRLEKSKVLVKNAPYIFGGKVVSSSCYYGAGTKQIYTSIKIHVSHIYKGHESIDTGDIQLVLPWGAIGEDDQNPTHGGVVLGLKSEHIFICDKNDYPLTTQKGASFKNSLEVKLSNPNVSSLYCRESIGQDFALFGLYDIKFKTLQEFYDFLLASDKKIKIPSEKKNVGFKNFSNSMSITTDLSNKHKFAGIKSYSRYDINL